MPGNRVLPHGDMIFGPGKAGAQSKQERINAGELTAARIEPENLPFELGVATIFDRETFEKLVDKGPIRHDLFNHARRFCRRVDSRTNGQRKALPPNVSPKDL